MPSSSSHRRIAYQSIKQTAEAYPDLSGSNILNMAHNKSAQFDTFYTSAVNYVKKLNKTTWGKINRIFNILIPLRTKCFQNSQGIPLEYP